MTYYTVTGNPPTQTRGTSATIRAEFALIAAGFTSAAGDINARGMITGQTWTGTHTFPATTYGVTAAFGSSGAAFATLDFVNSVAFSSILPGQTGNSGKFLKTDGISASWAMPAFQTGASISDLKSGSDNTKTVTPYAVLGAMGISAYFQTADQAITSGGSLTIAHGLGRTPVFIIGFARNVTAEKNYSIGDVVQVPIGPAEAVNSWGVSYTADSSNIYVRYGASPNTIVIADKNSGSTSVSTTNAKWAFFMRVWA